MPKLKDQVNGIGEKIEYSVQQDATLTREQIAMRVMSDLRAAHIVLTDVLTDPQLKEAYIEKYWLKYQQLHMTKNQVPLEFESNG